MRSGVEAGRLAADFAAAAPPAPGEGTGLHDEPAVAA